MEIAVPKVLWGSRLAPARIGVKEDPNEANRVRVLEPDRIPFEILQLNVQKLVSMTKWKLAGMVEPSCFVTRQASTVSSGDPICVKARFHHAHT